MKISKTDCLRTPKADGFYMPGEFEPHEGTLMIWPWRPGSWNYGAKAARTAFAEIAEAIAAYEQVYLFVRPQDKASAQELLSSDRIHLIEAPTEDAWARDTGATFVINDQGGRRGTPTLSMTVRFRNESAVFSEIPSIMPAPLFWKAAPSMLTGKEPCLRPKNVC